MRACCFALALVSGLSAWAQGASPQSRVEAAPASGIIHGPNHAYLIQAPKGWVLDNEIWAREGIYAVFYRAGGTLDQSPIVAYTMVQEKGAGSLEKHIQADLVSTLKGAKTAKVRRMNPLRTHDGREARVLTVTGVPGQSPEWVAYVDAPTVVILVSVSVRDARNFDQGESLLKDLVGSITWFTDQVDEETSRPR